MTILFFCLFLEPPPRREHPFFFFFSFFPKTASKLTTTHLPMNIPFRSAPMKPAMTSIRSEVESYYRSYTVSKNAGMAFGMIDTR